MHQAFARHCREPDFSCASLINYQLIDSAKDFPYDILQNYDAVVYSPILNKGVFNTSFLEERCDALGIKRVSYPWLQWGGYYPGAEKRPHVDWAYADLIRARRGHSSFAGFKDWALSQWLSADEIRARFEQTTRHLREHEERSGTDVRVCDFIMDTHRARQLFVTPDHPSVELYRYVFKEICDRLGVALDPAFNALTAQFHDEHLLPILPMTAEALGLEFVAGDYSLESKLGRRVYSYTEMLEIFYYAEEGVEMLSPEFGGSLVGQGGEAAIAAKQIMFARPVKAGQRYTILSASGAVEKILGPTRAADRRGEWWHAFALSPYAASVEV